MTQTIRRCTLLLCVGWAVAGPAAAQDSCMRDAAALINRIQAGERVRFVDIRPSREFEQFRIPGSINIPEWALSSKHFLRTTPFILLDKGYNGYALHQTCRQLREQGFQAMSLQGGLRAWEAQGGAIQGNAFAMQSLPVITSGEFEQARTHQNWLLIDVSPTSQEQTPPAAFAGARACPYPGQQPHFFERLRQSIRAFKAESPGNILIYSEQGEDYDAIQLGLRPETLSRVWYLQGGLRAYRHFIAQQERLRQGASSHPTVPAAACSSCPPGPKAGNISVEYSFSK